METKKKALGKGLEQLFSNTVIDFDNFEKEIVDKTYKVFPVYYPVGNGRFNIDKAIEDLKYIIEIYVKDTVKTK